MPDQQRWLQTTLLLTLTTCTGAAMAQEGGYQCTQGKLVRRVMINYDRPNEPVPCEVVYSKPTEGNPDQILWAAINEAGYCEFKANAFRDQLQSRGWSCSGDAPEQDSEEQSGNEEQLGDLEQIGDLEQLGDDVSIPADESANESE